MPLLQKPKDKQNTGTRKTNAKSRTNALRKVAVEEVTKTFDGCGVIDLSTSNWRPHPVELIGQWIVTKNQRQSTRARNQNIIRSNPNHMPVDQGNGALEGAVRKTKQNLNGWIIYAYVASRVVV